MKNTYRLFLVISSLVIAFFLFSCKTSVNVVKPAESYSSSQINVKPSVVSFTVQSKIIDIQNELNRNFTGLIYEDNSLEDNGDDNLMVKAWKQGDIRIDMKGNVLSYRVPLKTWIKAGFKFQKFGISLSDYRELNAALALNFKTTVTLNSDWTISTKTTSDGYEWLSTPVVNVGGIDMSVKFVADLIMQSSLWQMGKSIDESIKDYLNVKPYAQQAWELAGKPVKVNNDYNLWLQISPQKLISSKLNAVNGSIVHKAAITGNIKLAMNTLPPAASNQKPLPDLLIGDLPVDVTTIYAYVTMPYEEVSRTASGFLKGKTFSYGKKKVTVEDIKIYGNQGNIVAETMLSGSLKGTIFFMGKLAYNETDSTIVINDFDYDLSTKNFLIKSASWLYQDGFRKMIANLLKWSIKKEMVMIRSSVNQSLKNYKLADGIILNGTVNRVEPGVVYITPEGITPEIKASGIFEIRIEKLMFNP